MFSVVAMWYIYLMTYIGQSLFYWSFWFRKTIVIPQQSAYKTEMVHEISTTINILKFQ